MIDCINLLQITQYHKALALNTLTRVFSQLTKSHWNTEVLVIQLLVISIIKYRGAEDEASPERLNKGDNAWQLMAATVVGMVILYGSLEWKRHGPLTIAFAAVLLCRVAWGFSMSFGEKMVFFWGKLFWGSFPPRRWCFFRACLRGLLWSW